MDVARRRLMRYGRPIHTKAGFWDRLTRRCDAVVCRRIRCRSMSISEDIVTETTTPSGRRLLRELAETLMLAVPIALTQVGQIAMMTTDLALIGRLGPDAVAAAALANTVYFVSFTV